MRLVIPNGYYMITGNYGKIIKARILNLMSENLEDEDDIEF
jgi:hypothetical protein